MKKILIILFSLLFFSLSAQAKVKSKDIKFPAGVYTDEIKSCKAIGYASLDQSFFDHVTNSTFYMKDFPGFDWSTYHTKHGNSRSPAQDIIMKPSTIFTAVVHNTISKGDKDKINKAIQYLIKVAENKTLLNTITLKQLESKPGCWKNGDPTSPCWYHQYENAARSWTIFMLGATQLKPHMTEKEFKIVDKWAKKFWKKYYKTRLKYKYTNGFYAQANGGLGILVYAHWSDDKKLAANEINFRLQRIDHFFMKDGYIKGNSFRGNRSQWYHNIGVNAALGYIWIAKKFGAKVPESIGRKVKNSIQLNNLAIVDREKFLSKEWKKARVTNTTIGANESWYTHPESFGLDTLMLEMYGIKLAHDPIYLNKRFKSGIDYQIGFNPNCISYNYGNSKEFVTLNEKCKSLTKYGNNWYHNKCDELNSK